MIKNMSDEEIKETKARIRAVWRRMEYGGQVRWEIFDHFYDDLRAEQIRRRRAAMNLSANYRPALDGGEHIRRALKEL